MKLRTGAEYRAALHDQRKVWVLGEGRVEDVAAHPATAAMVQEYVDWYDRHFDAAWTDRLFAPADEKGRRQPYAYLVPKSAADLRGMGRSFSATTFLSGGNITHTPAYGHLIAMGIRAAVRLRNASPQQRVDADDYRAQLAASGRFLTFCSGAATIGARLDPDPARRTALRIVRETDQGLVLSGRVGMHTSPAYAEDVYIGALCGVTWQGHPASLVVPVAASGVTTVCRKLAARHQAADIAPMSRRYDELDGQLWLDEVLIPRERVFLTDPLPEPIATWLFWHQLYCWLSKAEFTLGLALACAHGMSLLEHEPTIEYLVDLVVDVQTVRTCLTAAELDPEFTPEGDCFPNHGHIAAGTIAVLKARQRLSEILRILPGSSLVVAPSAADLADPAMAKGLEESFAGGGYTARQRAALLQLAWDHIGSALDHREAAFELHANGGIPTWRARLRRHFNRYNELANAVLGQLDLAMPKVDVTALRERPMVPPRIVTPK